MVQNLKIEKKQQSLIPIYHKDIYNCSRAWTDPHV